jgi:hypothetical protein
MLGQGVTPNLQLIQEKLNLYDLRWSFSAFEASLKRVEPIWERDLRPLLPQFIPSPIALQAVRDAFLDASTR